MPAPVLLGRALRRAGITDIAPWQGDEAPEEALLLLRADHVYDASVITALAGTPGVLLCRPQDGKPVAGHLPAGAASAASVASALARGDDAVDPAFAGLEARSPAALAEGYNLALRKRANPYLLPLTAGSRRAVEWRTFGGAYKGVTDFVTKHVWPRPAFHVTRACAALGITPNMVTALSLAMVFLTLWLFAEGRFWPGLAAAWIMTFLDTVDGKLARVTLTSTKFGNWFDHLIDMIHPPFWWLAWIAGCAAAGLPLESPVLVGAVIFGGYVLQRLQEGLFIICFGMQIHIWRRFDSFFRQIIARRNPNLVMLTLAQAFGRPDLGILAVAVWTALGCVEQVVVTAQAGLARRRGPLRSWLEA